MLWRILIIAAALTCASTTARSHDIYSDWQIPGGQGSCCHGEDCRPTTAYVGADGWWRAKDPITGRELIIPTNRILRQPSPDSRCHVCVHYGTVLCFQPCQDMF